MSRDDRQIRVLHVEDDPAFADVTAEMLEQESERFTVEAATDASEGLDRLAEREPDCVVSDYQMPGRDGIEFLERIREDHPALPFILFTGEGSETVASKAVSAGATDYLQKGGGLEKFELLAHRIRNAVTHARAERERRRRLDALETAQEGISILDAEGRYRYVNDAYAGIFGYDPDEMVGRSKDITYPPGTSFEADIRPALDEQERIHRKTTARRADDTSVPIAYSLATTGSDGFVCTVRDLSESGAHHQEDASATVLKTIAANLPMGVLVEDADRNIRMANDALCEVLELSVSGEDLVGDDCTAALEEVKDRFADSAAFVAGVEDRIDQRETVYSESIEMADGRTLERDYIPYSLPEGPANLWLYRDVTDRVARERERKCNHRRFKALFDSPESFLAVLEPDGTVRTVNDTALDFVDVTDESVTGTPFWETPWWSHSESLQSRLRGWIDRAADGEHVRYEAFHYGPNGEKVTADGVFRPVTDRDGEVVSLIAEARDITERKQRKQALERQNERLDEFTSAVSHDLRSPLNVAMSRLELARESSDSVHIEHAGAALDRMETLIEDLLTFAREGQEVQQTQVVSLHETAADCWDNVETADATLTVEATRDIEADRGRVRQLLANLLRNSVEHAGDGVTVTVGELEDGFYVADDGVGIADRHRSEVFDAGYSTAEGGTGFGLNIVHGIATAHGWEARVTDSATGGARFEFTGVEFVE